MTRSLFFTLLLTTALCWGEQTNPSRDYIEASAKLQTSQFLKARAIGEQLFTLDPNSYEAHCILGQVHLWGEGNLSRADYHLHKALDLLLALPADPQSDRFPADVHSVLLRDLAAVSFEREDYEASLRFLSQHDKLYEPKLAYRRGWPLMKLGKFAQAESELHDFRQTLDEFDSLRVRITDNLGQLKYEQGELEKAEAYFQEASLLDTELSETPDPVYLCNLGEVQRDLGKFQAAEETWLMATEIEAERSYGAAYELLAKHYSSEGRHSQALEAMEKAHAQRLHLIPKVARSTRSRYLASLGEVLLAAGESDTAISALQLSVALPQRNARNSTRAELEISKRYLLLASAYTMEALREGKTEDPTTLQSGLPMFETSLYHLQAQWAFSLASAYSYRAEGFQAQGQAFGPGSLQAPWLLHHLKAMYPEQALSWLTRSESSRGREYLACIAPKLAKVEAIPQRSVLARAVAYSLQGDKEMALTLDPLSLVRTNASIGITVTGSREVLELLLKSPRFTEGSQIRLDVKHDFSAHLRGADGHLSFEIPPQANSSALAVAVYRKLFSPNLPWTKNRLLALLSEPDPKRQASSKMDKIIRRQKESSNRF